MISEQLKDYILISLLLEFVLLKANENPLTIVAVVIKVFQQWTDVFDISLQWKSLWKTAKVKVFAQWVVCFSARSDIFIILWIVNRWIATGGKVKLAFPTEIC